MFLDEDLHQAPILSLSASRERGEPECLQRLAAAGAPLVETWVVPAWLEDEFYRLNNLPRQLERIFAGVWGTRVDEERLAAASKRAQEALRQSYLLPERGENFVRALPAGPFVLRRPGSLRLWRGADAQQALWALKRLWAARWEAEAVMERGPELPEPEAVLLQADVGEPHREGEHYLAGGRVFACGDAR